MTDNTHLQPSELSHLLISLQDDFGWPVRSRDFDLQELWRRHRSGSAFYHMVGLPDGPALVMKVVDDWTARDAESMFGAMTALAGMIEEANIEGAHAVRPLGWAGSPPLVVMPYVNGSDVVSMLRHPEHQAWQHMEGWMTTAGQMLAAFHQRHRTRSAAPSVEVARSLGDRYRIRASVEEALASLDEEQRIAGSFGDIGPGNLLGTEDGDLYLLDPPELTTPALVHRDLGNFVFELRRQLAGRGYTRSRPVEGRFESLRSAFLDGYSQRSHGGALTDADRSLIALFELRRAAGMARKRLPGRPGDAFWFARSALRLRRQI